jgi:hypothetical protein
MKRVTKKQIREALEDQLDIDLDVNEEEDLKVDSKEDKVDEGIFDKLKRSESVPKSLSRADYLKNYKLGYDICDPDGQDRIDSWYRFPASLDTNNPKAVRAFKDGWNGKLEDSEYYEPQNRPEDLLHIPEANETEGEDELEEEEEVVVDDELEEEDDLEDEEKKDVPVEEEEDSDLAVDDELEEEEDFVADVDDDSDIFFDDEEEVKEEEEKEVEDEEEVIKEEDEEEKSEEDAEEDEEKKKEKKAELNVEEDVKALFRGEKFSKKTQDKIRTIFEAAVRSRVTKYARNLKKRYNKKLVESKKSITNKTVNQLDGYLTYVVENWMKENEVAIQHSLRTELAEEFLSGLNKLYTENYITIPKGKENLVVSLAKKVQKLEEKLELSENKNVTLSKKLNSRTRESIVAEACKNLADTESEKLRKLVEGLEFDRQFGEKIKMIKESYFPKSVKVSKEVLPEKVENTEMSSDVASVVEALRRGLRE